MLHLVGYKYYVSFIDDYSRFTLVYLFKNIYELSSIYLVHQSYVHCWFCMVPYSSNRVPIFMSGTV